MRAPTSIVPADGRLGILTPGLGAVATTFIAGIAAVRRGLALPIGSLTQMGTIRLGKRTDERVPAIRDFVPLAPLANVVCGGWDIFPEDCYLAALHAGVLERTLLDQVREGLEAVRPMPAVFDRAYVRKLDGTHVKKAPNKMQLAEQLMQDIDGFHRKHSLARLVMVWCGSTEIYLEPKPVHQTLQAFEKGLRDNDPGPASGNRAARLHQQSLA